VAYRGARAAKKSPGLGTVRPRRAGGAPVLASVTRTVGVPPTSGLLVLLGGLLRPLVPVLLGVWPTCFLAALHEVSMSSLLYGPGTETLAVVVLDTRALGRIGPTAALSVVLAVLCHGCGPPAVGGRPSRGEPRATRW
jgi:ABC-type Fe3+ transport system permease subunit